MKKVIKIIVIVIAVLCLCIVLLLLFLGGRPAAPTDYQEQVQTGGPIEKSYMSSGPYAVSNSEEPVLQGFSKYIIYYQLKWRIRIVHTR